MTAVIHVVTALERGGAQRVVLETAARLHDAGRPQLVITGARVDQPGTLDDEAERRLGKRLLRLPALVRPLAPLHDLAAALRLARMLDVLIAKHGSPAVVHTHSSKAGALGRLTARAVRGALSVHTVHGYGLAARGARGRPLLEAAERLAARAGDVLVFVSEADRRFAEAHGLTGGTRTEVIRAGVDEAAFATVRTPDGRAAARRALGLPSDAPLAVTVANLKEQKDPLFHLDVLHSWRALDPRAHLVFAGDGPLRAAVEARVRDAGDAAHLHLLGFVDDPRPALAAADVFLLASAWEGLPCAVLEATAAGLPAVVKDTGWAGELSWARSVRALPASASASSFAEALRAAVARPPRPARLPRPFTLDGMLEDLARLYDELIGAPRFAPGTATPRPRGRRRRR
ncbi:MAG: glycosyltransferase [Deltaproteobacteria bacterium]|nr:glycosyltransferase [Deltaproteobacteria bacterium]